MKQEIIEETRLSSNSLRSLLKDFFKSKGYILWDNTLCTGFFDYFKSKHPYIYCQCGEINITVYKRRDKEEVRALMKEFIETYPTKVIINDLSLFEKEETK
jgi:hypothetical protein